MTKTKKIRCSSLDLALLCPTSQAAPVHAYRPEGLDALAAGGTAKHKLIAQLIAGETVDPEAIADEHGVDPDELRAVVPVAEATIRELAGWGAGRQVLDAEVRLEGPNTIGASDLVVAIYGPDGALDSLIVVDWKTGWSTEPHAKQLLGYASGARVKYGMPTSGVILVVEVLVRRAERMVDHVTAAQLDAFEAEVAQSTAKCGTAFCPSSRCSLCRRQMECEARDKFIAASSVAVGEVKLGAITRQTVGDLYPRYQALMSAVRMYERILSAELEQGPIQLSDGRVLSVEQKPRKQIVAAKAVDVLRAQGFDEEDLAACMTASKTAIETVAKRLAGRGKGAARMREISHELTEAGAWQETTIREKVLK